MGIKEYGGIKGYGGIKRNVETDGLCKEVEGFPPMSSSLRSQTLSLVRSPSVAILEEGLRTGKRNKDSLSARKSIELDKNKSLLPIQRLTSRDTWRLASWKLGFL